MRPGATRKQQQTKGQAQEAGGSGGRGHEAVAPTVKTKTNQSNKLSKKLSWQNCALASRQEKDWGTIYTEKKMVIRQYKIKKHN